MSKSHRLYLLPALLLAIGATGASAADPTIEQVRAAATSGNVDQARAMMDQVLKDHPKSAKAHYVEAELMARQGQFADARHELSTAEGLAPGLPFASRRAVGELQQQLGGGSQVAPRSFAPAQSAPAGSGFSLWPILIVALIGFGLFALFRRRQQQQTAYPMPMDNGPMGYGAPGGYGMQPGPWGGQPSGGGMGSGIIGGLATGAAMGAGFAAGEAVVDHFIGGERGRGEERYIPDQSYDRDSNQDMGGNDFGINDAGSWDDGGDDNNGGGW